MTLTMYLLLTAAAQRKDTPLGKSGPILYIDQLTQTEIEIYHAIRNRFTSVSITARDIRYHLCQAAIPFGSNFDFFCGEIKIIYIMHIN